VSNANLGLETGLDTILEGFDMVSRVSGLLNLPVAFAAVNECLEKDARKSLGETVEVLPIHRFMNTPWLL